MAEETTTTEKVRVSFYNKNNPQPNIQSNYSQEDENANDYIKNKPGGYYVDFPEVDIVWDGVVGDKEVVSSGDVDYIKVSTDTISIEQLVGGILTATQSSGEGSSSSVQTQSAEIKNEHIKEYYDGVYLVYGSMFVVTKDSVSSLNDLSFTRGVYFMKRQVSNRNIYMSRFYCSSKKIVKKIPASFVDLKGGYDTEIISTELYNGNFSADDFVDVNINDNINTTKCVILQLKKVPQQGNRISGTINDINVYGTYQSSYVELKADNSSNQYDYVIVNSKDNYVLLSYDAENSPDTYVPTDISINLSLTVMSEPVKIPEEYLDTSSIDSSIEKIKNSIPPSSIVSEDEPTKSTKGEIGQSYYHITSVGGLQSSYIYSNTGWTQNFESRSYPKDPQINHTVTEDDDSSNIAFSYDDNNVDIRKYRHLFIIIESPSTENNDDNNDSDIKITIDTITISSVDEFLNDKYKSWYCHIDYVNKIAFAIKNSILSSDSFDGGDMIVSFPKEGIKYSNNMFSSIKITNKTYSKKIPVGTNIKIWLR